MKKILNVLKKKSRLHDACMSWKYKKLIKKNKTCELNKDILKKCAWDLKVNKLIKNKVKWKIK